MIEPTTRNDEAALAIRDYFDAVGGELRAIAALRTSIGIAGRRYLPDPPYAKRPGPFLTELAAGSPALAHAIRRVDQLQTDEVLEATLAAVTAAGLRPLWTGDARFLLAALAVRALSERLLTAIDVARGVLARPSPLSDDDQLNACQIGLSAAAYAGGNVATDICTRAADELDLVLRSVAD